MELFKLFGRLSVDGIDAFNSDVDKATDKGSAFASTLKTGLATAAKVGTAALTAAATATVAITKASIEAYAEYEQLVGGVETLFGAGGQTFEEYAESFEGTQEKALESYQKLMDAQNAVMDNAANAYKTAGLSANDYMETVTSFSASLLQGLGGDTVKAAEIADLAIVDMADNANKMGTSIESIQSAYQGFAKQNYTMLDNLKLGYGGTQSEMVRLINDSGILNETISDLDNITFDQMIEAIHVVQTEMGITGTTSKEASTTIQGSISSLKAAWENLLVGISDDDADFDGLVNNVVESVGTVADNLIPRISIALEGISGLIADLAPVIAAELPGLMDEILPDLISAATSLLESLVEAAPELLNILLDILPDLVTTFLELGTQLIGELVPGLEPWLSDLTSQFSEGTNPVQEFIDKLSDLWDWLQDIGTYAADTFKPILDDISAAWTTIKDALQPYIDALISYVTEGEFAEDLSKALKTVIDGLAEAYDTVSTAVEDVVAWFQDAVTWCQEHTTVVEILAIALGGLTAAIVAYNIQQAITKAGGAVYLVQLAATAVGVGALTVAETAHTVATNIATIATTAFGAAMSFLTSPIFLVIAAITALIAVCVLVVKNWDTIKEAAITAWEKIEEVWDKVVEFFQGVWDGIVAVFNKVKDWFADKFSSAWEAIKDVWDLVVQHFQGIWDGIAAVFAVVKDILSGNFDDAIEGIKEIWNGIVEYFSGIWDGIKDVFSDALDLGESIVEGIKDGITAAWDTLKSWVSGLWGGIKSIFTIGGDDITVDTGGTPNKPNAANTTPSNVQAFATGLDYVPYDDFPAYLHQGEMVLPANQADYLRSGAMSASNEQVVDLLNKILEAVQTPNSISINNREFGRIVRTVV